MENVCGREGLDRLPARKQTDETDGISSCPQMEWTGPKGGLVAYESLISRPVLFVPWDFRPVISPGINDC